jgi:hypothetical protein
MTSLVGADVFPDIEVFRGYVEKNETVYSHLAKYKYSDESLKILGDRIKYPKYVASTLSDMQGKLRSYEVLIEQDEDFINKTRIFISSNQAFRDDISSGDRKEVIDIYGFIFFKMILLISLGFNKSSTFLTLNNSYNIIGSPILTILSPLLYVIVPFLILRSKYKFKLSIFRYLDVIIKNVFRLPIQTRAGVSIQLASYMVSICLYLHGVYTSLFVSKNAYKVCMHLVKRIDNFVTYLKKCVDILKLIEPTYIVPEVVNNWTGLSQHNYGKKLVIYNQLIINDFSGFFHVVDDMFSNMTIIHLKRDMNMCYSTFIESESPILNVVDSFHLFIKNPVKNSFQLTNSNLIITGPNAGGKSTFIKSILLNVLLSQCFGISCAEVFEFTPFYFINSQINIPDSKGVESLFEAEMSRCKYNLEIVKFLNHSKSLIVMDELFSSTNVVEGVSGAYAILSKLSSYKNVIVILTTHYPYLTRIPRYKKYKIEANIIGTEINFPFKLGRGVSKQYIALDILKLNGFDDDIIKAAKEIQNRILV